MLLQTENEGSIGINVVEGCLVVTLPVDLKDNFINIIKENVLQRVSDNKIIGVIFDFSPLKIIDSYEFNEFLLLIKMIKLFGILGIIVGLQPGIVSALVDFDVQTDELHTFSNLETGLNYLKN